MKLFTSRQQSICLLDEPIIDARGRQGIVHIASQKTCGWLAGLVGYIRAYRLSDLSVIRGFG